MSLPRIMFIAHTPVITVSKVLEWPMTLKWVDWLIMKTMSTDRHWDYTMTGVRTCARKCVAGSTVRLLPLLKFLHQNYWWKSQFPRDNHVIAISVRCATSHRSIYQKDYLEDRSQSSDWRLRLWTGSWYPEKALLWSCTSAIAGTR